MDIEFNRRLESKNYTQIYQYLKEAYCNGAELLLLFLIMNRAAGNTISLSRRTSFIMGLKSLLDGLFGPEDPTAMVSTSLFVTYSGSFYIFKNGQSEPEKYNSK